VARVGGATWLALTSVVADVIAMSAVRRWHRRTHGVADD